MCVFVNLKGQVGDVDQLVVCQGEKVEEAKLRESSRLDLFHSISVDQELLQGGESVKRLLHSENTISLHVSHRAGFQDSVCVMSQLRVVTWYRMSILLLARLRKARRPRPRNAPSLTLRMLQRCSDR